MTITVYTIEDRNRNDLAPGFETQDYREAKDKAQELRGLVIATEFEYSDSYVVDNFTGEDDDNE